MSKYKPGSVDIDKLLKELEQYNSVAGINEELARKNSQLKQDERLLSENVAYLKGLTKMLEDRIDFIISKAITDIQKAAIDAIESVKASGQVSQSDGGVKS
jgi:hypothetical protein